MNKLVVGPKAQLANSAMYDVSWEILQISKYAFCLVENRVNEITKQSDPIFQASKSFQNYMWPTIR